jgi:hypothetical protein
MMSALRLHNPIFLMAGTGKNQQQTKWSALPHVEDLYIYEYIHINLFYSKQHTVT